MTTDKPIHLQQRLAAVRRTMSLKVEGKIAGLTGLTVEVKDFIAPVGARCEIVTRNGIRIPAQVIGFRGDVSVLMPLSEMTGISSGDLVRCAAGEVSIPVGDSLLGRVLNGSGEPIDGRGPLLCQMKQALQSRRIAPLSRTRITEPIGTGIRAIDALVTCGSGQRLGIFSGPGVGKSVLLGMIARYTAADVNVIALVGERGREVREFIEKDLGPQGLARSVVIVSTSDESAPLRVQAGFAAATIADTFRRQGKNVMMLMDSVTRIAMAQRQIGLAMGEPPTTKGFTPSVFALLPRLLESCGRDDVGSITGFFTVLVEGDDLSEPISDAMRSILDGHLWLSRHLANRGHYPAVDILESISRLMVDIVDSEHLQAAREITRLTAVYRDIEDLVNIGAYAAGTNPEYDLAVNSRKAIQEFLQQGIAEQASFSESAERLKNLAKQVVRATGGKSREPRGETAAPKPQKPTLGLERMAVGL